MVDVTLQVGAVIAAAGESHGARRRRARREALTARADSASAAFQIGQAVRAIMVRVARSARARRFVLAPRGACGLRSAVFAGRAIVVHAGQALDANMIRRADARRAGSARFAAGLTNELVGVAVLAIAPEQSRSVLQPLVPSGAAVSDVASGSGDELSEPASICIDASSPDGGGASEEEHPEPAQSVAATMTIRAIGPFFMPAHLTRKVVPRPAAAIHHHTRYFLSMASSKDRAVHALTLRRSCYSARPTARLDGRVYSARPTARLRSASPCRERYRRDAGRRGPSRRRATHLGA